MKWERKGDTLINKLLLKLGIINFYTLKSFHIKGKKLSDLDIPISRVTTAEQTHSRDVYIVKESDVGNKIPSVDGLITSLPFTPLVISVADCLPLYIYDSVKIILGLIHAGKKGLEKGIIENTVDKFKSLESNISEAIFIAGPHICRNCYDIDLYGLVSEKLKSMGISRVYGTDFCTYHFHDLFFSYHRGDLKSRMFAIAMIRC